MPEQFLVHQPKMSPRCQWKRRASALAASLTGMLLLAAPSVAVGGPGAATSLAAALAAVQAAPQAPAASPGAAAAPASEAAKPATEGAKPATEAAKPTPVEIHGSMRTRLEMWDWFGAGEESRYAFSGNILKLNFRQTNKHVGWMVELAAPTLLGLPEDAQQPGARGQLGLGAAYFAANGRRRNVGLLFVKQANLHLHHLGKSQRHAIRLGRFDFIDGTEMMPKNATLAGVKRTRILQRILGSFAWTHVGRSFDGAYYTYDTPTSNITAIGATPTRGVFQVDGWGWNQVAFGYGAYTKQFGNATKATEIRILSMYYTDWRDVLKTDNRPLAVRTLDRERIQIGTYGGHLLHARETSGGTVDFLVWGLGQTGSWGTQSHLAGAISLEAGWQPKALPALKPWIRGGYFRSTGDDDPNDGRHSTFFQLLPTPRPYARFPFFDWVNSEDIMASLVLRPHARVGISSEAHILNLSSRNDLWFLGGGVFQPWSFGYVGRPSNGNRRFANLYDISVDVKVSKGLA
ncbi:MAG: alginate export family protein, partial [Bryobacterales bacterium]|nr:alginate export family protein [Bryobacterales bacterium]